MRELTFLLTDIEDSTRLWEESPEQMAAALARHDDLVSDAVTRHGGEHKQARGEGDSHFAVFSSAQDAVECALGIQRAVAGEPWPETTPISVRIGIHSGQVEERGGDYYGRTVNRAARLRAIAHGGQTVMSGAVAESITGVGPTELSLRDRGRHRLKDLEEPLHVFELCHHELRDDFPPLRSLDERRHNLPIQMTSFIGREDEMMTVTKALTDESRLVTIAGMGGVGKTRLSQQVVADMVDQYPDGIWLVELADVTDGSRIAELVLSTIGPRRGEDALEELVSTIGSRSLLILLDNCEQVVAECAELVTAVLRKCPRASFLTTSREPLGVPGEKVVRLQGMAVPDLEHAALPQAYPAIRLFVERALSSGIDLQLDGPAFDAVVRVCGRLDGLPLAIELAAARVGVLTPQQIDDRLGKRFELLTAGPRTATDRQRTMRGAIDWSYDLLEETERILLRRLGIFVGGWTLEAAEAVCSAPPLDVGLVFAALAALVDKSLVVADHAEADGARYRMLESVLLYARDRLDQSGERYAVADFHLGWVVDHTDPEGAEGTDQGTAAVAAFRSQPGNVRAALDWAAETDPAAGLRVLWQTMDAWEFSGHSKEGVSRLVALLSLHPERDATRLYGLSMLGVLAMKRGHLDQARGAIHEAIGIARERNHGERLAANLVALANLAHYGGDVREAEERLAEAEALARASGNRSSLADVLTGKGKFLLERDIGATTALLEEALALRRAEGQVQHVQVLLDNLATVYARQGLADRARALATEAKFLAEESGDYDLVTGSAITLGRLALEESDFAEAESMFNQVLSLAVERDLPNEEGFAIALLGETARAKGNVGNAEEYYRRAQERFGAAGNVVAVAFVTSSLGHVALSEGRLEEAGAFAKSALTTAHELDIASGVVEFLELLGEVDTAEGRFERALRIFGAADALRDQVGVTRDAVDQGDYETAVAAARTAAGDRADHLWDLGRQEGATAVTIDLLAARTGAVRLSP